MCGCFEFEFLTEGPQHGRKATTSCCDLYRIKTASKLIRADSTNYTMRGKDGPGKPLGVTGLQKELTFPV